MLLIHYQLLLSSLDQDYLQLNSQWAHFYLLDQLVLVKLRFVSSYQELWALSYCVLICLNIWRDIQFQNLIGSPPGYVGYDEGGLLTEAVNSNPYAVLLLDEIEKAHPDIFNLLLQVMDHGMLTDANGREVDFRNVILVMTSNVGAQNVQRASIGFNEQDHSLDYEGELKKTFTPEFRNRLSEIIYFNSLSEDVVVYVVNKFIFELEDVLEQKNVSLIVSDNARKWFAENGYDSKMGARPMIRLIEKEIRKPLADELLFGKLSQGGTVKVGVIKIKLL